MSGSFRVPHMKQVKEQGVPLGNCPTCASSNASAYYHCTYCGESQESMEELSDHLDDGCLDGMLGQ